MTRQIIQWHRILFPIGILYGIAMLVRRFFYRKGWVLKSFRLPGRVISVGNLEVGGTGKSPVVIALAKWCQAEGLFPAILTRGYRSGLGPNDWLLICDGAIQNNLVTAGHVHADEAMMQSKALPGVPVIVGQRRRVAALQYLKTTEHTCTPDVWILDDGMQHLNIQRDVDIVLLSDLDPFDHHFVLPSGRLREFAFGTLHSSQLFLFTRADFNRPSHSYFARLKQRGIYAERVAFCQSSLFHRCGPEPDLSQRNLRSLSFALFAGIARPKSMARSLKEGGYKIHSCYFPGDHMPFDRTQAMQTLTSCEAIITSEKDWSREPSFFEGLGVPVFVTKIEPAISDEFFKKLKNLIKKTGKDL